MAAAARKAKRKPVTPRPRRPKREPDKLTGKQAAFVEHYLLHGNATQAAIDAGYSPKVAAEQGYENLRKPHIAAAVQAEREATAERNRVTRDEVIGYLRENISRGLQAEPVLDNRGIPTGEWRWDGAVVNKGAELLGKTIGIFVEKRELTGKDGAPLMPLETLRAALADARDG